MVIHETVVLQPGIEAARLCLRPLRRADEALIGFYAGDRRVAEMTTRIPHPLPPGAIEAFVARAMADERDEHVWVMDGTQDGQADVLGLISLKQLDREQSEIGYWVAPAFWNTGYASEAVQALVDCNPLDNKTIFAAVLQENPASARVLTNAGFAYLGDAEVYCVARGATMPTWTYLRKLD